MIMNNESLHFIGGALGGTIGTIVTCPLEVIKTKLQGVPNQMLRISNANHGNNVIALSRSSWHGLSSWRPSTLQLGLEILRKEGLPGLFRGLLPNVAGVAPARAIYFASFSKLKKVISQDFGFGDSPKIHFVAAAGAGIITATFTCPLWLVKTRIQLQSNINPIESIHNPVLRNYGSYKEACYRILKEEGIGGFYKGLSASYWNVFEGAIQFALYSSAKQYATEHNDGLSLSSGSTLCIAGVSKLIAASITYPLEVVRTRLREQRTSSVKYKSVLQTIQVIAKEEGMVGLYGGLEAHLLRVVPNAAIMFLVVEFVLRNEL